MLALLLSSLHAIILLVFALSTRFLFLSPSPLFLLLTLSLLARRHALQPLPLLLRMHHALADAGPQASDEEGDAALERAQVLADAVSLTRDWVNMPPRDCTPPLLA